MIVLDWDRAALCGLSDRGTHAFRAIWPDGQRPSGPLTEVATWLRDQLSSLNTREKRIVLCLPREDVIVRHLELPPTPEAEQLDVVRLQTMMRSTVPLGQLMLDFLPIPGDSKEQEHTRLDVLAATTSTTLVETARQLITAAGYELVAITLSGVGHAATLVDREHAHSDQLLIAVDGPRIEMTAVADGRLIYTHGARVGSETVTGAQVAAEVSRGLFAARRVVPTLNPSRVVLASTAESASVSETLATLEQRLKTPITSYFPVADHPAITQPLAAAAAGCLPLDHGVPKAYHLDFLSPRTPAPVKDMRKTYAIGGAIAACGLLLAGFGYRSYVLSSLQSELDALTERRGSLKDTIDRGKNDRTLFLAVGDWKKHAPTVTEELDREAKYLTDTTRLLWTSWEIGAGTGTNQGTLHAVGLAKSRQDYQAWNQRLVESGQYRVPARELADNSRDPDYTLKFDLAADLLPPPPPKPGAKPASGAAPGKTSAKPATPAKPVTPIAAKTASRSEIRESDIRKTGGAE